MRLTWLRQGQASSLVLIYSGWAVGAAPFAHLRGDCDVLVLDDYRDEALPHALLAPYGRISVLAYSLGVAVAARQLAALKPARAVAVCGSPHACHESRGIDPGIFARTLAEVTPAGLARFARRAGVTLSEPLDPNALRDELAAIAPRPAADPAPFDRIYAGRRDRIFTASAMQSAWAAQRIDWLDTGHNPFPLWQEWQEILG